MIEVKKYFAFTACLLCCMLLGIKFAMASYTLTFKPKYGCSDGKIMMQGSCIDSNSSEITSGGSGIDENSPEMQSCRADCEEPNRCLPNGEE